MSEHIISSPADIRPPSADEVCSYVTAHRPPQTVAPKFYKDDAFFEARRYKITISPKQECITVEPFAVAGDVRTTSFVNREAANAHLVDLMTGRRDFDGWWLEDGSWVWWEIETGEARVCATPGCTSLGSWVIIESFTTAEHVCTTEQTALMAENGVTVDFNPTQRAWDVSVAAWHSYSLEQARDGLEAIREGVNLAESLNANMSLRRPLDYCAEPHLNGVGGDR